MSEQTMSFRASLSVGSLGETLFFSAHPSIERLDGRKADGRCIETGAMYELKTDTYPMAKTENFFIEKTSDLSKQSNGGPWQARANGCKWFVYLYVSDLVLYTFDTDQLIERVESLAPQLQMREIKNTSWTTSGYLLPRASVMDIATRQRLTVGVTNESN